MRLRLTRKASPGKGGERDRRLRRKILAGIAVVSLCSALAATNTATADDLGNMDPTDNELLTLQNDLVKVGVDLDWGGALSVLVDKESGRNLINRHDVGRLAQQSYYGAGKYAGCDFGLNPVQGGDRYANEAGVQAATKRANTIYVRSRPLDWCLDGETPDVTYENWYTLEEDAVHVFNRATVRNVGHGGIRSQEWPAIFTIPELQNFVRYDGKQPFTGGSPSSNVPGFPNEAQYHSEGWGSHLDDNGEGLGWFVPNVYVSTNYNYVGNGGTGDLGDSTSYTAPIPSLAFQSDSVLEYEYWLMPGAAEDVRDLATGKWADSQSTWVFDHAHDRQMWSTSAPVDGNGPTAEGWTLNQNANQAITLKSPPSTIPADERHILEIEMEHSTGASQIGLRWQTSSEVNAGSATLPIKPTGERSTYRLDLSSLAGWTGTVGSVDLALSAPHAGTATIHRIALVGDDDAGEGPSGKLLGRTQTKSLGQGAVDLSVWSHRDVTASVEYGVSGLQQRTSETRQLATESTVHLSGLQPGRRYWYRVHLRDAQGREEVGPTMTFDVPSEKAPATSLTMSVDPVSQSASAAGEKRTFAVTLDARAAGSVSGTLTASAPEGWTVSPDQRFSIVSNGSQTQQVHTVDVEVPAGMATDTEFPIEFVARTDDGIEATASATVTVTTAGAAWEFNTDGDAEGWAPTNSLAAFVVSDGALQTRTTGGDPYLTQTRPLAINAGGGARVEIAMQTTTGGTAQLFFSTPTGAFSETNSQRFPVSGGSMRSYTFMIPTQTGPINGLRFDPPDGAGNIQVDYIRVTSVS